MRLLIARLVAGALPAVRLVASAVFLGPPDSVPLPSRPPSTIAPFFATSGPSPTATTASATASKSATPAIGTGVGQAAPDFALRSLDGQTVHLSDYRGRPVWINFWAPWCPPCREEMPRLEGVYLTHR